MSVMTELDNWFEVPQIMLIWNILYTQTDVRDRKIEKIMLTNYSYGYIHNY